MWSEIGLEINLGNVNARTNGGIKMGHNLFKMWQSGEFSNEQYRSKGEIE